MLATIVKHTLAAGIIMSVSACALHTRNVDQLPQALHTMRFNAADTVSIDLSQAVQQQFKALGVIWTNKHNAPQLNILSDQITYSSSNQFDSNTPSSFSFTEVTNYSITYHNKVIYGPTSVAASTSMTMNQQSIYAGGTTDIVRQQLNNNIVTLLYNRLIAGDTKTAINKAYRQARRR
jgi:outer membrane lipopolysaccharide assembly protein LptE/RlpB